MPRSSSHTTRCAACRFLCRRCTADCVFLPYFPADRQDERYLMVHRVFGTSNAAKILQQIDVSLRHHAAETLVFQAEARLRDPVYGSVSLIARLNETQNQIQHEISSIMSVISYYQSLLSSPNPMPPSQMMTVPMEYDQEQQPTQMLESQMTQQQQQQQQHEMMMGYDDQHEQQQMMMMMMMMAGEVLEVAQLEP
ncbi:LOB domain-containing protein 6 [Acorus gramineus]|uniref:LOB domain-containing protein 6 n=1 Tax=Acorus gramineus TaxID=55184 RepID=A0AAV9AUY2_ACOGR|nr:LOB domain-containing protein 6 [Acorus gramineus]